MRWQHSRGNALHVPHGKTVNARREIPLSDRVMKVLSDRRESFGDSEWVFPLRLSAGTSSNPH